ncbi:hypothetical protein [Gayadomonas joobiniege]|nr:hypothetical protein [Gayadomonas joobiniege]
MTCEYIDPNLGNEPIDPERKETIQVGYLSLGEVNGTTFYHQFLI